MKRKTLTVIIFLGLVALINFALAMPNLSSGKAKPVAKTVKIPATAIRVTDHIFRLGTAIDAVDGKTVEGYAILHYAKQKGSAKTKPATCYGFLSQGAKWKSSEPWLINPLNQSSLGADSVFNNLAGDILKWEDAADGVIGNNRGTNILGNGSITDLSLTADMVSPDGKNEVYFADIEDPNTIAMTIIWGIFSGPLPGRQLVEWDQVYDDVDYPWSLTGESGKMDFDNIATHELGHSVGMADLYTSGCGEETMYGYAGYGEIKKRDLNVGDIAGINKLY